MLQLTNLQVLLKLLIIIHSLLASQEGDEGSVHSACCLGDFLQKVVELWFVLQRLLFPSD
jgi:hypothetical protein